MGGIEMEPIKLTIEQEQIVNLYYENNAKRLYSIVNKILRRFGGISNKDVDEFYSLATEVFIDALQKYDRKRTFDSFLYVCLSNKIKTEMTRRNREKRKADRMTVPIDSLIGDGNATLADILASDFDVEKEIFGWEDERSSKIERYLDALSKQERKVVELLAASFRANEIKTMLHISEKEYQDAMIGIHAYENISLLF